MREACPCWKTRSSSETQASRDGTRQHEVVETGQDDERLDDDQALAAAQCMDFYEKELTTYQAAREAENQRRIGEARAAGQSSYNPPANVLVITEDYLPVDDLTFEDITQDDDEFIRYYTFRATTAGYIDRGIISWDQTCASLFDWKFGRWIVEDAEFNLQGIAYCLGLFEKYPLLQKVKLFFKQPHIDHVTEATFTRADIERLYLRVQVSVRRAMEANRKVILYKDYSDAQPHVPVCNFCARIGTCPKVYAFASDISQKFAPLEKLNDIDPTGAKPDDETARGLRMAQVMAVWSSAYKSSVLSRTLLSAATGEAKIPEGFRLETRQPREIVDEKKFKEVTLRYVSPEQLAELAHYTFGDIEDAVKEGADRGSKTTTLEKYKDELLAEGATALKDSYTFLKAISVKKPKAKKEAKQ